MTRGTLRSTQSRVSSSARLLAAVKSHPSSFKKQSCLSQPLHRHKSLPSIIKSRADSPLLWLLDRHHHPAAFVKPLLYLSQSPRLLATHHPVAFVRQLYLCQWPHLRSTHNIAAFIMQPDVSKSLHRRRSPSSTRPQAHSSLRLLSTVLHHPATLVRQLYLCQSPRLHHHVAFIKGLCASRSPRSTQPRALGPLRPLATYHPTSFVGQL